MFLGIAEKIGMLPEIGKWVLEKALHDLRRWKSQGHESSFAAVNISGVEFAQEDFVQYIINMVDDYGMKPADIELEVTETEVIADMDNGIRKLGELRDAGFKISLDDF
ncbi:MAG: EAL domain-containing protein, partial [Porticoccaceae bacterium]|nr:EAL domain-containing protein [Porticoccaceae bacterium]